MRALAAGLIAAFLLALPSSATINISWASITILGSGWSQASVSVQTDGTFENPDSCANTGWYKTDPSDSGTELYNGVLLTAYAMGHEVRLALNGCVNGYPRIVGVQVRPPQ